MTDKTTADQGKKPGEKPAGKFHYNPGNMAGKTVEVGDPDGKSEASTDKGEGGRTDRRNR